MQNENTTGLNRTQQPLLTTASAFSDFDCLDKAAKLMEVRPGMLVSEALSSSSNMLNAVTSILDQFIVNGLSGTEIYGIRFMVEAACALVDASAQGVEFGNGATQKAKPEIVARDLAVQP